MKNAKLTPKQAKFVIGITQGKSATKSAYDSYNVKSNDVAKVIASENLTKPNIKEALQPYLEKHLINLDTALAPIGEGLKENHGISTRLQASDRAMKLLGIGQETTPNLHLHLHKQAEQLDL